MNPEFGPNNNDIIVNIWYYAIILFMVSAFVGGVYEVLVFIFNHGGLL